MNPKYHLLVAVAALSLGACSTDDTQSGPEPENGAYKLSFTVAEDSETRTTLDAGDILRWKSTDQVGIYTGLYENPNTLTVVDVNQSPVEFNGVLEHSVSPGNMFYAYYPYNAAQSTAPSAVKLSIPAAQKQTKAGVYNGESNPLVAVPMEISVMSDSHECHMSSVRFRQLGAIVELQLFSSDEALRSESIRSVAFVSDTPLAGDFSFDLTTVTVKEELSITGYESKVATTLLEEPAAIPAAGGGAARVYLTIAPGQYTGQIVVNTDAAQYTFRLAKAMTFDRAVIKGLPADLAKAEREILSDAFIHFEDPKVKQICVLYWDKNGDGELSYEEAAAVTSIGSQFKEKSIHSFNELRYFTGLRSIENYAFYSCGDLTSIDIPDGVTAIGEGAFSECNRLTSIKIPDGVTYIGSHTFYNCWDLTSIHIPEEVTAIGNYAFYYCSSLTSINLPERVTAIGDYAFWYSSLTSIHIPDGVTYIGIEAFLNCFSLTSVHIPDGVTKIRERTFSGCTSLTSIHIPDRVTKIGNEAFCGCHSLTSINIPDGVTEIGDMTFEGCRNLTSIRIPDGVTAIGFRAFWDCESLTSIHISDGVTAIGNYAFFGCSNLTSIHIPNGVTEIGKSVFQACGSLTNITIPDGVITIGKSAFDGCSLTSITIPNKVTEIGEFAFSGNSSLTSVYCKPTTPPTLYSDFGDSESLKIYVPAASVNAYKTAEGWQDYDSCIFADNN